MLSNRPSIPSTPKAYVTTTGKSGNNWYRKWSDGFIEQSGQVSAGMANGVSIALITPMATTTYAVFMQNLNNIIDENHWFYGTVYNRTTANFSFNNDAGGISVQCWYVCGY